MPVTLEGKHQLEAKSDPALSIQRRRLLHDHGHSPRLHHLTRNSHPQPPYPVPT